MICLKKLDEYKNSDGDISQTIIVTYKSVKFPLGPKHAFHLHYKEYMLYIIKLPTMVPTTKDKIKRERKPERMILRTIVFDRKEKNLKLDKQKNPYILLE